MTSTIKGSARDDTGTLAHPAEAGDELMAQAEAASEFLKALAHQSRLLILCQLVEGERTVSELEALLNMRQPAVSQQLARLRADGLVTARRDGKNIHYAIGRAEVRDIIAALYRAFCS
jgi:DNA-binding transcriptional ArsR family regulator